MFSGYQWFDCVHFSVDCWRPSTYIQVLARVYEFAGYIYLIHNWTLLDFCEKPDGHQSIFHFSCPSYSGCFIVIVLNFSGEINHYKRLLEPCIFGGCVCVHWLGGLNLCFPLWRKSYYGKISQIFKIASLDLGTVCEQFCCIWRDIESHIYNTTYINHLRQSDMQMLEEIHI